MKNLSLILSVMVMATMLTACSAKRDDLKSPCVGIEDSPCGPKRNVNDWWLS